MVAQEGAIGRLDWAQNWGKGPGVTSSPFGQTIFWGRIGEEAGG